MADTTEHKHWNQFRTGDRAAFLSLYESYYQALYAFGCRVSGERELVKDAIHELFCELWDRRFHLPEVTQIKSYLFTYLKRKLVKEQSLSFDSLQVTTHQLSERSYEEMLMDQQTDEGNRLRMQQLLTKLTPGQREMIRLRYYEQLSYESIAEQLQVQPRTVYNQISEALKTLRKHVQVLTSLLLFFLIR